MHTRGQHRGADVKIGEAIHDSQLRQRLEGRVDILHPASACIHIDQAAHDAIDAQRHNDRRYAQHRHAESVDRAHSQPDSKRCRYGQGPGLSVAQHGTADRGGHAKDRPDRYIDLPCHDHQGDAQRHHRIYDRAVKQQQDVGRGQKAGVNGAHAQEHHHNKAQRRYLAGMQQFFKHASLALPPRQRMRKSARPG